MTQMFCRCAFTRFGLQSYGEGLGGHGTGALPSSSMLPPKLWLPSWADALGAEASASGEREGGERLQWHPARRGGPSAVTEPIAGTVRAARLRRLRPTTRPRTRPDP